MRPTAPHVVSIRFATVAALAATLALAAPARAEHEATLWTNQPHRKPGKGPTGDLADLAERARPAVVHVRGTVEETSSSGDEGGKTSIGTGFIIHKAGF